MKLIIKKIYNTNEVLVCGSTYGSKWHGAWAWYAYEGEVALISTRRNVLLGEEGISLPIGYF